MGRGSGSVPSEPSCIPLGWFPVRSPRPSVVWFDDGSEVDVDVQPRSVTLSDPMSEPILSLKPDSERESTPKRKCWPNVSKWTEAARPYPAHDVRFASRLPVSSRKLRAAVEDDELAESRRVLADVDGRLLAVAHCDEPGRAVGVTA